MATATATATATTFQGIVYLNCHKEGAERVTSLSITKERLQDGKA